MADRKTTLAFQAGGICLAIGLLLVGAGIHVAVSGWTDASRLEEAGQVVTGTVIAKVGNGRRYVKITYRFTTRTGETITGKADVWDATWLRVQQNRQLRVTYVPDNPQIHRVDGQRSFGGPAIVVWEILGVFVGAMGALLVGIGFTRLRGTKRHRR